MTPMEIAISGGMMYYIKTLFVGCILMISITTYLWGMHKKRMVAQILSGGIAIMALSVILWSGAYKKEIERGLYGYVVNDNMTITQKTRGIKNSCFPQQRIVALPGKLT